MNADCASIPFIFFVLFFFSLVFVLFCVSTHIHTHIHKMNSFSIYILHGATLNKIYQHINVRIENARMRRRCTAMR